MSEVARNSARQSVIAAYVTIVLANMTTAVAKNLIQVPAGAIILGGNVVVSEVFNSTTSDVLDIGDSGSANRYKNDVDLQSLGLTALTATGYVYTAPTLIQGLWVSGGGTPTTGIARLTIWYIRLGRADMAPEGLDYGVRLA